MTPKPLPSPDELARRRAVALREQDGYIEPASIGPNEAIAADDSRRAQCETASVKRGGSHGSKSRGRSRKMPLDKQRNINAALSAIGDEGTPSQLSRGPGRPLIEDKPKRFVQGYPFCEDYDDAKRRHPEAANDSELTRIVWQENKEIAARLALLIAAFNEEEAA